VTCARRLPQLTGVTYVMPFCPVSPPNANLLLVR
jgi:hypothetical protein